jgi:hypothetical protein
VLATGGAAFVSSGIYNRIWMIPQELRQAHSAMRPSASLATWRPE